ncbi:uncharacterized protein [Lepeophtheirus salmonis]|uniref:uncharacterized protein isoform X2 n=1 Tax=Lepeophtheirus salmonis TaxID=72036 RepID=UPI003AF3D904
MDRNYKGAQSSKHYRQQQQQQNARAVPCWNSEVNPSNGYDQSVRKTTSNSRSARSSRKSNPNLNADAAWLDYEASHPGQAAAYWSSGMGNDERLEPSSRPVCPSSSTNQYYVLPPPPSGFDHRPNGGVSSLRKSTPRKKKSLASSQPCLQEALDGSAYIDDELRYFPPPPRGYYADEFIPPPTVSHRPASSSSNYNRHNSSRRASPFFLPRSESFSARSTSNLHAPPPVPTRGSSTHHSSHMHPHTHHHHHQQHVPHHASYSQQQVPPEPSLSPLEVVRHKRASQAEWEKRNMVRASSVESCTQLLLGSGGKGNSGGGSGHPSSLGRKKSSLHRSSSTSRKHLPPTFYGPLSEDILPPPPSPPCTCGKNLVLPPAPDYMPKGSSHGAPPLNASSSCGKKSSSHHPNQGFDSEASLICDHSTAQMNNNTSSSPRRKAQPDSSSNHLRNGHVVVPRLDDDQNLIEENKRVIIENGGFMSRPPSVKGYTNTGISASSDGGDDDIESNSQFLTNGYRYVADEAAIVRNAALVAGRRRSNAVQSCSSLSPTASGGFRGSRSLFNGSPSSQRAKFIGEDERGISLEIGKFVALITVSGIHFRRQHWCILSLILLIIIICVAIGLPISDNGSAPIGFNPPPTEKERLQLVSAILSETPLIDGHNDLPWNIRKFIHNKLNLVNFTDDLRTIAPWKNSDWSHTDLKRLKAGNIGAQFWVAYAPCGSQHKDSVQITLEQIDLIKRFISQYPTYLQFVNDSQALIDAHSEGRIASLISVESGHAIGTSLGVLRMFQRLGAISMTLTHNCNTPWADCSKVDKADGKPEHDGLTSFGKIVISEMNRLGMIIDLSHSSRQTAMDTIAASEAPVIFSHSSAYFLCNSTRNVPDDILKAVARKNGLVMVNFFSYFLTCSNISSIEDVVAHINHIRKVAGIDHVGIGASYDGINSPPTGLEDVSKYPYLFSSLLSSGNWTPEDLKKLAGQNFIRVFQEIEKVSIKKNEGVPH